MPGLTQTSHASQHWWIWVPTNPASLKSNYKGPARLREIMWAQWSIHIRPLGVISLRGAWASGCYTAPGQCLFQALLTGYSTGATGVQHSYLTFAHVYSCWGTPDTVHLRPSPCQADVHPRRQAVLVLYTREGGDGHQVRMVVGAAQHGMWFEVVRVLSSKSPQCQRQQEF